MSWWIDGWDSSAFPNYRICLLWRRVWAWRLLACVSVNRQQHVLYRRQMSRGQRNGRPHREDHPGVLCVSARASLVFDERKVLG